MMEGGRGGQLWVDLSCFRQGDPVTDPPTRLFSVWFLLSVDLPIWGQGLRTK